MNDRIKSVIAQLELFDEKMAEVRESTFSTSIFAADSGITITAAEGKPVEIERRGPKMESIRAAAPAIRLLISKKDRISFQQMEKLYLRLVAKDKYSEAPNKLFLSIQEFLSNSIRVETGMNIVPLEIDGSEPSVQVFLEQFIYGDILHLDEQKRQNYVNWRTQPVIFEFALNTFCFLSARILQFAIALSGHNYRAICFLKTANAVTLRISAK